MNIYLYGKNWISEKLINLFNAKNISLKGVIDQQYQTSVVINNITYSNLDIIADIDYKDDIVIICLQNALLHEDIANKLNKKNFQKILYLPMSNRLTFKDQSLLRNIYRELLSGNINVLTDIPEYKKENCIFYIINKTEYFVSFLYPVSKIFLPDIEIAKIQNTNQNKYIFQFLDNPIINFTPYINLFYYLSGNKNIDISTYFQIQDYKNKDKIKLLNDRKLLYSIYEENYKYNMNFFYDSPASAKWNEIKKHINIIDGVHRIIYLLSKGEECVPIQMNCMDYNKLIENS